MVWPRKRPPPRRPTPPPTERRHALPGCRPAEPRLHPGPARPIGPPARDGPSVRARPPNRRAQLGGNGAADPERPPQHHVVDGLVDLELTGRVTGAHPQLR